ncbi:UDP-N-acetylmuramoylalanyl-D-glutamate--2,6-diaminopimelate ligase [Desulfonatronum thiosulfatophilum]|uniref:UDP-N-acetylmuramoyl-L-alanyl-D-glutamate--2,6-diaminopimelate ligase n=1 Tax=Desulfonatronum thiosulfatophilum TaxID=617002 RepID=A0A1G6ANM2_9BACT|nr:UDP-N-acetylmuramoylalanyl-D-glutamate--2,6-diaminopimelate ligase [Desulfonatronum thiosulfatophilum]
MSFNEAWHALKTEVRNGRMVRTHSGQVQPGDVFVALAGTRVSGSTYIAEAIARNAGYVVTGPGQGGDSSDGALLLEHPDPREALGELAAAHFGTDASCPLLVGVTGTNGKTTIIHLLEHLLRSAGMRVGLIGTIGATWPGGSFTSGMTTPDCWTLHQILARMRDDGVTHACMEVSSHALQQKRTAGLRFEVAALTNITQDHLDYHQDMESYYQAKARLFAPNATQPEGPKHRVINADDPYGQRLLNQWGGVAYTLHDGGRLPKRGQDSSAAIRILHGEMKSCDRSGLELRMDFEGQSWVLDSSLVGRHNASNLLAAQGVGLCLGLESSRMTALEDFSGVPGRLERVTNPLGLNIFVDYAHTPDALENVLNALRELRFERLIVVFGCGGNRDRAKRPLMGQAVCRFADIAVLTSDNPRHEDPETILNDVQAGLGGGAAVIREVDRKRAIERALEVMRPDDVLLVAGKGHEATQQIGEEYFPFHDPTVIRRILGEGPGHASGRVLQAVRPCA